MNKNSKKRKVNKNRKPGEPIVIEFNLSKSVAITIAIVALIVIVTTGKVVITIMEAQERKTMASTDVTSNENVTWVNSTLKDADGNVIIEKDENGNEIKIPVPKGYSASQIDGETTASKGFVIYEGDIDWGTILVDSSEVSGEGLEEEKTTPSDEISKEETTTPDNEISTEEKTSPDNEISTEEKTNTDNEKNTEETTNTDNEKNTEETTNTDNKSSIEENITIDNKTNLDEIAITKNESNLKEIINSVNETNLEEVTQKEESIKKELDETIITDMTEDKIDKVDETNNNKIIENEITEEEIPTEESTTTEETITPQAETTSTQTEINIFNLQKTRNQYVWVPVNDISEIYGVDSKGKLWGKFYNFSSSGRTPRNWTETNGVMKINSLTSYREPDVISFSDYFQSDDEDNDFSKYLAGQTRYEMLAQEMEQNFYEMIKSIEKYGGFYIGRYETGGLKGTAVVKKMNTNIGDVPWYTLYEKNQELKGINDNIETSMIWGSLWDATLEWLVDSGATNSQGVKLDYSLVGSDSKTWGNYYNTTFNYIDRSAVEPLETKTKALKTETIIPTGSSNYTKVNNIYDMAGNVYDWTLETSSGYRIWRGGVCADFGVGRPADDRDYNSPTANGTLCGSRAVLWIK